MYQFPRIADEGYWQHQSSVEIDSLVDAIIDEDPSKVQMMSDNMVKSARTWLMRWKDEQPIWVMEQAKRKSEVNKHEYTDWIGRVEEESKIEVT